MLFLIFSSILVAASGIWLVLYVEKRVTELCERNLERWERLMIPIPIILLVAGNLDGAMSLMAFLESNPNSVPVRYPENQAWNADRLGYAAFAALALLPFVLVRWFSPKFILEVWFAHIIWLMGPFCFLLAASGVPFRS